MGMQRKLGLFLLHVLTLILTRKFGNVQPVGNSLDNVLILLRPKHIARPPRFIGKRL